MRNLLRAVLICIALVAMIPATWIAIYAAQRALGYFPGGHFPTIAQYAAEQGDVRLCRRIIGLPWPTVGGPSTADARLSCIHDYASLTHDPSACELLMPSEYGWSCLGVAREKGEICSINYGKDVSWWIESPYDDPQKATFEECKHGQEKTQKGKDCCHILLLSSEPGINDCSRFEGDTPYMDLCLSQLAMKQKEQNLCAGITDGNARSICGIRLKYM